MKEFRLFGINRLIEEFINPLFVNLVKPFWGQLAMTLAPMAIDMFSGDDDEEKAKLLNKEEMAQGQAKTQSLVDEQLGLAEDMMDPESELNQKVLNVLSQQASETGAETASAASKLAAQTGAGGGQAIMQQQNAMNQALGGVGDTFADTLNSRLSQSMDLKNKMITQQKGLEENLQNVDIANINAQNMQAMMSGDGGGGGGGLMGMLEGMGMDLGNIGEGGGGLFGGAGGFMNNFGSGEGTLAKMFGSDKKLKKNIELVGKSNSGINVYEFDYKDKSYGEGRYRGIIAQEVPNASFKHNDGYLWVDYNKVDVNFERIG